MKNIFLIAALFGNIAYADFTRSEVGVVIDSNTNLQWQDDYSDNGGNIKYGNWEDAIVYCADLDLDGGGWRLPNIRELVSSIDDTRLEPAISTVFINKNSEIYWSSTSVRSKYAESDGEAAYTVLFNHGYQGAFSKPGVYYDIYIRCVR